MLTTHLHYSSNLFEETRKPDDCAWHHCQVFFLRENIPPHLISYTRSVHERDETYKDFPHLIPETIVNIISFVPVGLLCGKRWRGILIGIGFSLFIEIAQLISHRGFFEIDDLISNTLGTIIGVAAFQLVMVFRQRRKICNKDNHQGIST